MNVTEIIATPLIAVAGFLARVLWDRFSDKRKVEREEKRARIEFLLQEFYYPIYMKLQREQTIWEKILHLNTQISNRIEEETRILNSRRRRHWNLRNSNRYSHETEPPTRRRSISSYVHSIYHHSHSPNNERPRSLSEPPHQTLSPLEPLESGLSTPPISPLAGTATSSALAGTATSSALAGSSIDIELTSIAETHVPPPISPPPASPSMFHSQPAYHPIDDISSCASNMAPPGGISPGHSEEIIKELDKKTLENHLEIQKLILDNIVKAQPRQDLMDEIMLYDQHVTVFQALRSVGSTDFPLKYGAPYPVNLIYKIEQRLQELEEERQQIDVCC